MTQAAAVTPASRRAQSSPTAHPSPAAHSEHAAQAAPVGAQSARALARAWLPAVVVAGDGRASKAIYGENKAYLKVAGCSMLARVVALLQRVPEVSEVWVVGDAPRIRATLRAELVSHKPLHIVPQQRNLLENAWQTYRRLLPDAPPEGRDPRSAAEFDQPVLYLSSDLPFATPEEVSAFTRAALARDCDYVLGLAPATALRAFSPSAGQRGIHMASFHVAEGCYRQSNLHLVRPARLGNRIAIEHVYEHRYQKHFGQMLGLAWYILNNEGYAPRMLLNYLRMHLSLLCDRLRLARLADWLRRGLPLSQVERAGAALLGTRFRLSVTEAGGCAVDIDNERDLEAARARFEEWTAQQSERVRFLYGALPKMPVLKEEIAKGLPVRATPQGEAARAGDERSTDEAAHPQAAHRGEASPAHKGARGEAGRDDGARQAAAPAVPARQDEADAARRERARRRGAAGDAPESGRPGAA